MLSEHGGSVNGTRNGPAKKGVFGGGREPNYCVGSRRELFLEAPEKKTESGW